MLSARIDRLLAAALLSATLPATDALIAEEAAMPGDLSGYRFVNALVINDPESPLFGFHHFYVNEKGLEPLAQGGPYPEGTVFIGMVYALSVDGLNINEGGGKGVALMEKVAGAEETGGWRFSMFDPEGNAVEINAAQDCFACHTQVKDRDYVFTRPLGVGALSNL